jgi:hypothetical protein
VCKDDALARHAQGQHRLELRLGGAVKASTQRRQQLEERGLGVCGCGCVGGRVCGWVRPRAGKGVCALRPQQESAAALQQRCSHTGHPHLRVALDGVEGLHARQRATPAHAVQGEGQPIQAVPAHRDQCCVVGSATVLLPRAPRQMSSIPRKTSASPAGRPHACVWHPPGLEEARGVAEVVEIGRVIQGLSVNQGRSLPGG